jgi:hypothetical protein
VRGEEPQRGARGGGGLANAVAGADGDAVVIAQRLEKFALLAPRLEAEDIAGVADRVGRVDVGLRVEKLGRDEPRTARSCECHRDYRRRRAKRPGRR